MEAVTSQASNRSLPLLRDHALNADDKTLTAKALAAIGRAFLERGLSVAIDHDFDTRLARMEHAEDWPDRYLPIFDPALSRLDHRNAFWLRVQDIKTRRIVACFASRIYHEMDLHSLFTSGRIISDSGLNMNGHSVDSRASHIGHIQGTLAYMGAGWVDPAWRHQRIPVLGLKFMQGVLLQDYQADFSFGLLQEKLVHGGVGIRSYNFHNIHAGFCWNWPDRGPLKVWLHYNDQAEMLDEMRASLVPHAFGEVSRDGKGMISAEGASSAR